MVEAKALWMEQTNPYPKYMPSPVKEISTLFRVDGVQTNLPPSGLRGGAVLEAQC